MALIDRISNVDITGMSQANQDLLLKGMAHSEGIHDGGGNIDISDPAALKLAWKNKQVKILVKWAKNAQDYEDELVGYTDISGA